MGCAATSQGLIMQSMSARERLILAFQVGAFVALFVFGGLMLSDQPEHACEYRACADTPR